jgi:hypothetical protein
MEEMMERLAESNVFAGKKYAMHDFLFPTNWEGLRGGSRLKDLGRHALYSPFPFVYYRVNIIKITLSSHKGKSQSGMRSTN